MASILETFENNLVGAIPGFKNTLASIKQASKDANEINSANFNKNIGYSFRIVEISGNLVNAKDDVFILQLNPQEINQDEPFAIQIIPTQQGIITEHQGSVFKNLEISGTTGMTPGKGAGGVRPDGRYRFARGETGFDQFHKFRNYIRKYAEDKKNPENKNLQLVFENPKDGEYFIVEPLIFKMKRNKQSRFTYNYDIQFRVIGRLIEKITSDRTGWFANLISASKQAVEYINEAEGIILGSTELLTSISNDFANIVLEPLQALNSALQSFNGAVTTTVDIPRRTISRLRSNIKILKTNLAEAVNIDVSLYNSLIGRISTTQNIKENATFNDYQVLNALAKAERATNIVLSNNGFFGKSSLIEMGADLIDEYEGRIEFKDANAAITKKVRFGDTVQIIAMRELGDVTRFRELIILNQLKPPYINNVGGESILKPGDDILIPVTQAQDNNLVVISNQEYPITENLTFAEKKLGIDLALDKNFDLIDTNLNDFKLIASHDNATQAVRLKIGLEKGSLKFHPEIGNRIKIGEKIGKDAAFQIQQDLTNSILLDPRFDIAKFTVSINGGTISIDGFVKEKGFDLATPINLTIRV